MYIYIYILHVDRSIVKKNMKDMVGLYHVYVCQDIMGGRVLASPEKSSSSFPTALKKTTKVLPQFVREVG